uniref:Butyrophilin subfamily 2 member A2-like n=1 Tax=Erpetoichthys calabaricus TaxID=27687 RepID=A0A8C4S103_ERPCA
MINNMCGLLCRRFRNNVLERISIYILILESVLPTNKGNWTIAVPNGHIIGFHREDVILPCSISPAITAVDMEVTWFKGAQDRIVHSYFDRTNQPKMQQNFYQGRTVLPRSGLPNGNLSLKLKNLHISDSGAYTCSAFDKKLYEEGEVELIVGAIGTEPIISVDSAEGDQRRLMCKSDGWNPEPVVIWRNVNGKKIPSVIRTSVMKDDDGLLSIRSYVTVKENPAVITCLIRSKISHPDWETYLYISRDFFPAPSGWMFAFFINLAISVIATFLVIFHCTKMNGLYKQYEKKVNYQKLLLLMKEIDSMRTITQSEINSMKSLTATLTLDTDTAHPELKISTDGKGLKEYNRQEDILDNPERFDYWACVVAKECFGSGRHYWEIDVAKNIYWVIGVCRDSARRKGDFVLSSQYGYWTLSWQSQEFCALTCHASPMQLQKELKPQKLGVYLDHDKKQLSFYNVDTQFHIYTYSDMRYHKNEKVFPFFRTRDRLTDLIILEEKRD